MKKFNKMVGNFKILGLNIGHMAVLAGLAWSVMQITSTIKAEQREEIIIHNDLATAHPLLQQNDKELKDAVKAIEKQIDSNFQLILTEIRRINAR